MDLADEIAAEQVTAPPGFPVDAWNAWDGGA
jgi:hypothetical protein